MQTFLQEKVQKIFSSHQDEMGEISIIIPNRRAAVYIQKYLAEHFTQPFFAPEILTIHDWINKHTKEKMLGSTELLFILYDVHCQIEGENKESFEKFMLWGKTILADFDEIDKYMIKYEDVFKNLREIKKLESWDLDPEEMSEAQKQFHSIWEKLSTYYTQLEIQLSTNNATYPGRAYAHFLKHIDQLPIKNFIYFIGFNAVSEVEKRIMKHLINDKRAQVFFDVDQYYMEIPHHEAAYFYKPLAESLNIPSDIGNCFNDIPKHFKVIETAQQVGQAKIGGALVEDLLKKGEKAKDIAVVLADESLLIPLSRSLPAQIETANITMGWPLKYSLLKGFLDIVFEFQINFEKFGNESIYHKTLIEFLQHPYSQEILENKNIKEEIQIALRNSNIIFTDLEFLMDQSPLFEQLKMIFFPWGSDSPQRLIAIQQLMELLYQTFKEKEERQLDIEILFQFNTGFTKFQDILKTYEPELSFRVFRLIFFQFWQGESLSFYGNPIDGLQVMGILETRTLDFKNVVMIGMNEGNLPKTNPYNSFIPKDLRYFLGLPTEEDKQAIFAHHFYRLLQRAKNIYMTYNSGSENLGTSEKSRYITQLENELDMSIHQWEKQTYTGLEHRAKTAEVVYKSTAEVQKKLDALLEKGLSPSAINKLITCPLDFYYRYVLNLKETDDIEENIENSTFGTKIHTVLQAIIEDNFKDGDTFRPLEIEVLKKENSIEMIEKRLTKAYLTDDGSKKFTKKDLKYGQNKLSFEVSRRLIGSFLNEQIKELKQTKDAIIPVHLEKEIYAEFKTIINGEEKVIRLQGQADRIDQVGNRLRILDYKSGKSDITKLQPSKNAKKWLEEIMSGKEKEKARQLFMYGLMFRGSVDSSAPFSAGIISMINISDWIQYLSVDNDIEISEDLLEQFQEKLIEKIRELYDSDFEFKHEKSSQYCQHCGK